MDFGEHQIYVAYHLNFSRLQFGVPNALGVSWELKPLCIERCSLIMKLHLGQRKKPSLEHASPVTETAVVGGNTIHWMWHVLPIVPRVSMVRSGPPKEIKKERKKVRTVHLIFKMLISKSRLDCEPSLFDQSSRCSAGLKATNEPRGELGIGEK